MLNDKKIVLGMSGGVDSSISAYLLKEKGFEVIPVFLRVFDCENSNSSMEDAKEVCDFLKLKLVIADIRTEFENIIINPFMNYYLEGLTPNPCVYCNYTIKWPYLVKYADMYDAAYVATGHYANIIKLSNGRYSIKRKNGYKKDQSYVMYHLSQDILKRIIFALSDYEKTTVRKIATEISLPVAQKKDSQEICFVSDNYVDFIEKRVDASLIKCGKFLLKDGTILGEHKGLHTVTIGQRKGLGISYTKPLFVCNIGFNNTDVILGDNEDLFKDRFVVGNVNFMAIENLTKNMRVKAAIRYGNAGFDCTIRMLNDSKIEGIFDEKQRAITKGQAAVFYKDDYIVAGGIIE